MLSSSLVLLHHVTYAPAKFEVAKSNGLGKDAFTRNVTDIRMDGRTLLAFTLFFFIITIIWSTGKREPADKIYSTSLLTINLYYKAGWDF